MSAADVIYHCIEDFSMPQPLDNDGWFLSIGQCGRDLGSVFPRTLLSKTVVRLTPHPEIVA